jgi:uncharacterized protein YicC (UPF0701 family)
MTPLLHKHLDYLEAACAELESLCITNVETEHDERVSALEVMATDLDTWRLVMESSVATLKLEVQRISKRWDHKVFDKTLH